jgi:hypothetical protein
VDDHEFDVRAFEERCGQARAAASLGSWPRCSELASQALALSLSFHWGLRAGRCA